MHDVASVQVQHHAWTKPKPGDECFYQSVIPRGPNPVSGWVERVGLSGVAERASMRVTHLRWSKHKPSLTQTVVLLRVDLVEQRKLAIMSRQHLVDFICSW